MDYVDNPKERKEDRILVLKAIDGKPLPTTSMRPDKRLFTGDNKLHAILDRETCLWHLKYDFGIVPLPLKQKFTSFSSLYKFVSEYYGRRNIEITEVID